MTWLDLPAVNATLNGLSAVCLGTGYFFIQRDRITAHRNCMVAAFVFSTLFLISYLAYHAYVSHVLGRGPTIFRKPEWFRPFYLAILGTHTVLAAIVVPLALSSLYLAWKGRFEKHKRLSRWTFPVWMYVSVTGVLIYYLLYIRFPQS